MAALLAVVALLANGGTLRVSDRAMGAYRVSVYTDPTPPRPDSLDVSVLVVRDDDPRPVEGLEVRVDARWTGPDGAPGAFEGREVSVRADRGQADDPRYYAAKFAPEIPGEWVVDVTVRGPEGEGTATFRLEVREAGLLDRPWVVVVLALLPLALLAGWLARSGPPEAGDPASDAGADHGSGPGPGAA